MNNRKIWLGILLVLSFGPYVRARRARNVASQEEIEKIKYLLKTNPEQLNSVDENGETLLYKATKNSSQNIVRFLLIKRANVNIKNSDGSTPLHIVTSTYIARDLINKGADLDARDNEGKTPLHRKFMSPTKGDIQIIKELIKNGADVNAKDNNGRTLLHIGIESSVLKLLFENGADVNAKDNDGATPLHMAAKGYKSLVVELIENGANVNAKDNNGQTPLHYWAAEHFYGEAVIEYLIAKGADINATDNNCLTPLHLLLKHKSSEASIKRLIAKGANVNAKDKNGMTPLHFAATISSMQEDVDYLAIDSQKNTINESSELPSFYFISKTSEEEMYDLFLEELLKAFAEKDIKGKNNDVDYFSVTEKDYDSEKAKILLSNGAYINIKDNLGRTPLHIASVRHDLEIVKTLINNGADVNVKDNKGMTPLHWAAREGISKIFWYFIHRESVEEMASWDGGMFKEIDEVFRRNDEMERRSMVIREGKIGEIAGDAPYLTLAMSYDKLTSILKDLNREQKKNESIIAYFIFVGGHEDVIRYLVSKGAKINAIDNGGRSPLAIAEKLGRRQVVNLLSHLEKGTPPALFAKSLTKPIRVLSKMLLTRKGTSESKHISNVKSNRPALRLPHNGKVTRYHSNRRAIAPFEIKTRLGSGHYFVKLVKFGTKKVVLTIFVHGGRSAEVKVPLGSYELKYAVGKTWYGPERLFGPDTKCNKADKILDFEKKGNQVLGHSVELYLQLDGNLQIEEMPRSEF